MPEILKVINKLNKYYNDKGRTTLNRMRKKPNAFKILISCLLSLRTQDKNTDNVSRGLFLEADTPEKLAKINMRRLEKLVFSSGHYRKKARTIKNVSKVLIDRYNGKVPNTKDELLSIKGVGPKTANIVLAFAFGKNVIPVDVHVHVIANRLGWVDTKKPEDTEKELEKVVPKKFWRELNAILVLFGKEVCVTRSPFCSGCPVGGDCPKAGVGYSR